MKTLAHACGPILLVLGTQDDPFRISSTECKKVIGTFLPAARKSVGTIHLNAVGRAFFKPLQVQIADP